MSVFTATITSISDGNKVMNPAYELLSIDICHDVNRIPSAQIILLDGNAATQKFDISNTGFFEPGKIINIKLRYEGSPNTEASVFQGVIVRHALEASAQGMMLTVEMKDAAIKMTQARKSCVFQKITDSEIIRTLISNNGLKPSLIADTKVINSEIVQYYCSDWDFMLARADLYGMLVAVKQGDITLAKLQFSGSPKHSFEFGISDIINFEIEVDANHQYAEVEALAWDLANQKLTAVSKAKDFSLAQGNLKAKTIAAAVGGQLQSLSSIAPQAPEALQAWADGAMIKSRIAMIRGRVSVPGTCDINCLDLMEIAGVSHRVNGKTLVTGVRHRVDENGWQTDVQFGLSADAYADKPALMDRPAAGQLPGVNGLQIGLVTSLTDPDKQSRIKVMLPSIDEKKGEVWARLAAPDAGKGRGYFFRPELGDEVIVGFFNDDPRQAVILGSMYSPINSPPDTMDAANDKNLQKGIVTRSGITLGFVDDEKALAYIETPNKNTIIFDDKGEMVKISDQHGNLIVMNKDGIEIKSAKDLKLSASGNVEIKGNKVDVQ